MDKFLIIDGSSLLTTNYFALLPREIMFEKDEEKKKLHYSKIMHSSDGTYTNAIYGTFKAIKKIIDTQNLTHIAIVFDKTRDTFRRELYSDYKGTRKETQEPLKEQFKLIQELFVEMGINVLCSSEYEADDYAGSLSKKFASAETRVYLLTKDHDYIQLVDEYTYLWMMQAKKESAEELYEKYYSDLGLQKEDITLPEKVFEFTPLLIKEEFGIEPKQIIDVKGISGDASDNIPGIKGISDKTATLLLNEYGTLENLFEIVSEIDIDDKKQLKELNDFWKLLGISRSPIKLLKADQELGDGSMANLSKKLATIKCDIPLEYDLDDFSINNFNKDTFKKICERLDIKSIDK